MPTNNTLLRFHGAARWPAALGAFCLSLAGVALCTWLSFQLGLGLATAGFLYLVIVVVTAIYGGFWSAAGTSLVAVNCLNYFFVEPILTFRVGSPADWIALCAFVFTALVVSRLSYIANLRAAEATAERRDSERLYETSRRILLFGASREPGALLTALIREVFELEAVVLFDGLSTTTHASGTCPEGTAERTRSAYLVDKTEFDPVTRSWYCALHLDARPVGGLALCGGAISGLIASGLASLCATALERARSVDRECRAEAARQSEQLRAAVLDALGHEFKTPVTTIWTASSGLLELGGLTDLQNELLQLIDEQSRKLNSLATRLLTTAKLDSGGFQPRRKPMLCSSTIESVVRHLDSRQASERIRFTPRSGEAPALADPKLVAAAMTQLLDNALKYSIPESQIEVSVETSESEAIVSVRSHGVLVDASDRERIFERFYRAKTAEGGPAGTGLGLSIVKRIAEAHQGRVWVESESVRGTVFFFALPLARKEPSLAASSI